MKQIQKGFTLIELIVVIVILGILAATAMPKFADLSSNAKSAAQMGLMGAMNSAATLAHATYLATGVGPASSVTLDGQAITMINGYPTANAAGIAAALQGTDYSYQGVLGVGKSATCYVGYVASVGGLFPSIGATSSVTGC